MRLLYIEQFGVRLWVKPIEDDSDEINQSHEDCAEAAAKRLVERNKMDSGYFDLILHGSSTVIDHIILVA